MLQSNLTKRILILSRLLPAFLFLSCSIILTDKNEEPLVLNGYTKITNQDFIDHFAYLENLFLNSSRVKVLKNDSKNKTYISNLAQNIIKKNRIFFITEKEVSIHIIKSETPFHFSLPARKIFLSTGLFKKYIQNESLLMCVLVFELIRSEKNYYKKNIILPKGYITAEEILPLLRLSAEEKMKIHKWSFRLLKKVNVDSDTYLSWLQIQNRNSIDFSMQLGDINKISREEALFKAFIIDNSRGEAKRKYRSSTKDFYRFLRTIRNS